MALILFPDPAADSFVSLAQAELYISMLTMNSNEWKGLSPEDQERLLRIAYRDIIDHTDPKTYPTTIPACVGEAQALMASHDNVNSISSGIAATTTKGAIKKQKVGSIEQEFYDSKTAGGKRTLSRVPSSAYKCLSDFGYSFKTKTQGLSQTHLGRM